MSPTLAATKTTIVKIRREEKLVIEEAKAISVRLPPGKPKEPATCNKKMVINPRTDIPVI
jgi:hypothetical protein